MLHKEHPSPRSRLVPGPTVGQLLDSPFARRKLEREREICRVARLVLSFCRYRRAADHFCQVRPSSRHSVLGLRRGRVSCVVVDLAHPMRWYEEVFRRGLA